MSGGDQDQDFEALLDYLKESRGFDFTGYKRSSLVRRVDRRLQELPDVATYSEYVDRLEVHPDEFTSLFNNILINVTDFFRDPEAWDQLRQEVVPGIQQLRPSEPIRVWSAGCASGQEPYSVAMLLAEALGFEEYRDRVKIYATDVDEEALAHARQAVYSEREAKGLTSDQLERWFEPQVGGNYAFSKELRRSVIFGRNDLVQDAPISRIDLLLCRNTLMYFNAETQARILQRLHFALKPRGVLFLGKAEMLLSHSTMFTPVDLKRRFFRKADGPAEPERQFDNPARTREVRRQSSDSEQLLRESAWLSSGVAQVVLDVRGRLVLANHRADSLFGVNVRDVGRPFQDLEISYRPVELRSYLETAREERRPVWVKDVEWLRAGEHVHLDIQVVPLTGAGGEPIGTSIVFHDITRYHVLHDELIYSNRQLETAYEELQSTNEELETTNEELQSTVEELETTNEELQSTNEELETMNEELQSMNDELQAANEELRERTAEVDTLNIFLESVLTSLRACVMVLDRDWRIQVWNRPAEAMWGLRRDEAVGEHLFNLDIGLPVEALKPLLRQVLAGRDDEGSGMGETLDGVELDAVNRRGRQVRVHTTVSPLTDGDGSVTGAIVVVDQVDGVPSGAA